jgi:DNA (cytosine-5)-methyltransferase 1
MRVLDLFSGIGGFALGLERAGMEVVAFCEIDPFCQAVLKKHWPHVPCYDDVTTLTGARLATDGIAVDLICGGFPCQDISVAGKGAGIGGERSGLWSEYARIIGELGPAYVIVENVSALLNRGMDVVLGDLAALGYDAEWHCIPASAVGAPHERDRVWIIAYSDSLRPQGQSDDSGSNSRWSERPQQLTGLVPSSFWVGLSASDIRRMANGLPRTMGKPKLHAYGNAVVPQIPEIIGRAIMRAEAL